MPASVTYATRSPVAHRVDDPVARSPARCARAPRAAGRRRARRRALSSARVRRVSSAAITSASRSASTARGDRSPRLPIGVATSTQRAASRRRRSRRAAPPGRPSRRLPALERARLGLDHERGARARSATPATARRRHRAQHDAVGVAERDVDREPHADGVHVAARPQHQRAVDAVAPEQAAPARARGRRRPRLPPAPRRRARARPSAAPSHVEADLEDVAVDDLVVLALDAQLARSLALVHEPISSSSSQWITSARMKPRCRSEWITPAHSGALAPARNVHARDSLSPVVRNVRRPSRWYAARATRGTAPSPRPRPSSISARALGVELRRLRLELHAHAEHVDAARPPAPTSSSTVVELVLADVHDRQHRLVREQERRREQLALVGGELGPVERRAVAEQRRPPARARRPRRPATCRPWPPAAGGRAGPRPSRGRRAPARARACRGRRGGRRRP